LMLFSGFLTAGLLLILICLKLGFIFKIFIAG